MPWRRPLAPPSSPPPRKAAAAAAAIVCALALSACAGGQGGERDDAREVAARFASALERGDGQTACAQLSEAAVEALEQEERAACAEAITELALDGGAVEQVEVFITNAQALYASGERAYLDRAPDGWRLTAVGCRFEDGKPRSRPATCELEA